MAKLDRIVARIFGSGAGADQIGVFGSLFAGSEATTTSPATAQSLSNWLTGWFAAAIGGNAPAIEDMNSVCFVLAYQIAYMMQAGVPEYNVDTTYYIGSLANDGLGNLYVSIVDDNLAQALTNSTKWQLYTQKKGFRNVSATSNILVTDYLVRGDATSGSIDLTLPLPSVAPLNMQVVVKAVGTGLNLVTVLGSIDNGSSMVLNQQYNESATFFNNGTTWDVI